MAARMRYPEVAPEGYAALSAFGHYVNTGTALEPALLGFIYLRASVLNGCEFCTELHKAELRKHHEPESRIDAVTTGPESDAFTPRERAALRWTEVMTRIGSAGAPDAEYLAVSAFFHGKDLVDLTFAIGNINAWNRMGIAFRPEWRPRPTGARTTSAVHLAPATVPAPSPSATDLNASGPPELVDAVDDDGGKVASS